MTPGRLAIIAAFVSALSSCLSGADEAELRRILDGDREAHLATDASALVAHLADSVTVVDAGSVVIQSRGDIEAMFRTYFDRAAYDAWDDVGDPVIAVSRDGSMAWVARRVRVDRTAPRLGGLTTRERFESAWVATYEAQGDTWRMTSVSSTFAREPSAARILAAARRAVGGEAAIARVRFARFDARASGPGGAYRVAVVAGDRGEVRIDFSTGFSAGISEDGGWVRAEAAADVQTLSDTLETFIRGHDLVMTTLAPDTRYGPLRYAGRESFGDVQALRIDGMDALGSPIQLYYSAADTMPLGFRLTDHVRGRQPVTTSVSEWRESGEVRLPGRARFVQGDEVFEYDIWRIETGETIEARAFGPETPGPPSG